MPVKLQIYNTLGQLVKTLVDDVKEPGTYNVVFNAKNMSSGIYFFRLSANTKTAVKKCIYLK